MKKSSLLYFILLFIIGCNSRIERTYVKEFSEPDSSTHYSITYDKEGNVIDEYKSDEYLELEAKQDKMFANHHLYSIKDLSDDGIATADKSNLQGVIIGSKDNNDDFMILRSEDGDVKAPIDEKGKFEFFNLPLGTYHMFVSNTTDQLTFIDKIDLKNSLNYKLMIEKNDE